MDITITVDQPDEFIAYVVGLQDDSPEAFAARVVTEALSAHATEYNYAQATAFKATFDAAKPADTKAQITEAHAATLAASLKTPAVSIKG